MSRWTDVIVLSDSEDDDPPPASRVHAPVDAPLASAPTLGRVKVEDSGGPTLPSVDLHCGSAQKEDVKPAVNSVSPRPACGVLAVPNYAFQRGSEH